VLAVVGLLALRMTRTKKSLQGKTIVLTGGATGLGREQAFALAKAGVGKLILWDINMEQLEATAQDVKKAYPNAQVFAYGINLVNREAIYALAKKVVADHGFVWGLINNAGVISGSPILDTPDKKIELTMGVNVMAHFWTIKAFLPEMYGPRHAHHTYIFSCTARAHTLTHTRLSKQDRKQVRAHLCHFQRRRILPKCENERLLRVEICRSGFDGSVKN
jgi:all-trans-retinol dehydrogenase (NAD+)